MELTPYVDSLRRDLAAAAEAASAEVRDAADRLSYAVEPSLRMVLLEALGVAAAEVTDQLADVVVDVRLRGRDPEMVVQEHAPPPEPPAPPAPPTPPGPPDPDEGMARVSLRLPESLKARVDEAAAAAGQSANAWIVRALTQVLEDPGATAQASVRIRGVGQRLTGWQR
jgi:HicB family